MSEEQWQSEFDHLSNLLDQKDAEIERLKAANTLLQRECANRGALIADLERLIVGAADALEEIPYSKRLNSQRGLITELRKAAQ